MGLGGNKFTATENHECKKKDCMNSVQSSLKSHTSGGNSVHYPWHSLYLLLEPIFGLIGLKIELLVPDEGGGGGGFLEGEGGGIKEGLLSTSSSSNSSISRSKSGESDGLLWGKGLLLLDNETDLSINVDDEGMSLKLEAEESLAELWILGIFPEKKSCLNKRELKEGTF